MTTTAQTPPTLPTWPLWGTGVRCSTLLLCLVLAVVGAGTLLAADRSEAHSYTTMERYLKDRGNHYAYRQLTVQWSSWSGGETYIQYIGSRGGATYGYSFSDWGINIEALYDTTGAWSEEMDPGFYEDWTNTSIIIQRYNWGYFSGDIQVTDGWCHSNGNCYPYNIGILVYYGSGFEVDVPYLSSLGWTGSTRYPWQ